MVDFIGVNETQARAALQANAWNVENAA